MGNKIQKKSVHERRKCPRGPAKTGVIPGPASGNILNGERIEPGADDPDGFLTVKSVLRLSGGGQDGQKEGVAKRAGKSVGGAIPREKGDCGS